MDALHLNDLREKEAKYWWHVNKRKIVDNLLGRSCPTHARILEVGCGGGLQSSLLEERGHTIIASDISSDAVRFARERGVTNGLVFDAGADWPIQNDSLDVVLMLDVLEHLEEDRGALREAVRVLKPGASLVLTVPAYPCLFSAWDEMLAHKRRYTRSVLRQLAEEVDFQVEQLSYWNIVSLPPALVLRSFKKMFPPKEMSVEFPSVSGFTDWVLKTWGGLEAWLIERLSLPLGLSLAGVLRKKGTRL